ncbi:MAG TPA: multicopper oxidase family protein [Ktedonobacteraceae bacterium]|nr:multicopper oxidase family protein [Ktedonobacteraceae bacterium]
MNRQSRKLKNMHDSSQGENEPVLESKKKKPWRSKKAAKRVLLSLLCLLLAASVAFGLGMWTSRYPDAINMGTACNMGDMPQMQMHNMPCQMNQGNSPIIPLTSLQAPQTAASMDEFTLTAENAHLPFMSTGHADAWTFNGTSPGPTLRVRQGDLVMVHLVNHLSTGVTIHWHGVAVPNSADGVAGVTQDAVRPGQTYTYRFLAKDPGTYWYHSHQESFEETGKGLYGMLIVEPARTSIHDDVDLALALHIWDSSLAFNMSMGTQYLNALPGQWVRLRLVNTDNGVHLLTLTGTSFLVAALDGHDLNEPAPLKAVSVSIDAGQRYDLRFQIPQSGPVALFAADENGQYQTTPRLLVGPKSVFQSRPALPPGGQKIFDFTGYGQPAPDAITPNSHFDVTYTISLGYTFGFSNMRPGPVFTLNGKSFPDTPMLMVRPGELVRLRFVNDADAGDHPMHLHGHTFTVLAKNGHSLTGSPVHLDTISVGPHESYDVAFYANNPGLWMIHCHNLYHANHGMDMMLVYPNISTPYSIGYASGNFPD